MRAYKKIFFSLLLSGIVFLFCQFHFSYSHAVLLAIIALLVVLWTNEGLPLGVVSLLPIILLPAFGILNIADTAVNYSNPIIFLFLGGFMLAITTEKIGLHEIISNRLLILFPKTPWGIIFSIALTSALLSSVLSNTTVALLMMPIAALLTDNNKVTIRLLLGTAYGASIGGIITPIGTPPNLIFLGFLEKNNIPSVSFFQWILFMLPLALMMLLGMTWIISRGISTEELKIKKIKKEKFSFAQKQMLFTLGFLIVLLLLNSPIKPYYNGLGLDERIILLLFGLLMFLPKIGFLTWEDSKRIPYEIIFLFGAGFAIASAFSETKLSDELANYLLGLKSLSFLGVLIVVITFAIFLTEIMSNTALVVVLLPVLYGLSTEFPREQMMLLQLSATIAASYAFMLPIATPPNAIVMSTGLVKVKDMIKYGFVFNILGIILITAFAYFYWQWFLQ